MNKEIPRLDGVSPASFGAWLRQLMEAGDMPARIIRPSRFSVTGYVPTAKGKKAQDAESMLEQDFLTLLEYDKRVERYLAQPFTIKWTDATGRPRRYTPDAIVKFSYLAINEDPQLQTTVYEVKPRQVLRDEWSELKPKFRAAIGWAKEYGCRFHLVTESRIRTPYLKNARFLLDFRSKHLNERPDVAGARQHLIARALHRLQQTTPRELLAAISRDRGLQAELIPWMWNLVGQEFIGVDLAKPLTMASPIWPTNLIHHLL